MQEIPLFPLRVVMFPGGRLELQIFERRYLDLVSHCMRNDKGFGICLLKEGEETIKEGTKQTIHRSGTYVSIVDWDRLENGLLGITVEGSSKFRVADCWQADSGVLHAEVVFSDTDSVGKETILLDDQFAALADLLHNLEDHPLVEQKKLTIDYDNLWDIGWRLSELIPIEVEQKQQLLEIDDPWERIENIEQLVSDLANEV
ncbi:MAG: LON peptidase substrate-binding domain-containing protein [Gammaproteobacteria bacterium]|nr:LON peptidase substrate-binding domain-containing protein [Gammaproteobacteria bacterium]MDP6731909.1 LON peptidase substrate-binding domain-containing protein [Gammaproteobacteria bacterium]